MNTIGPVIFTEVLKNLIHQSTNFALNVQREMDHRDVIKSKSFRSSGILESILPRLSVIDDYQATRKVRNSVNQNPCDNSKVSYQEHQYLGKTIRLERLECCLKVCCYDSVVGGEQFPFDGSCQCFGTMPLTETSSGHDGYL